MSDTMDIRRVAELAKLHLTAEETARLSQEMPRIIAFAKQLEHLDLGDALPMANQAGTQVLRADEVQPSLDAQTVLAAAPAASGECIVVPRTVEEGGDAACTHGR